MQAEGRVPRMLLLFKCSQLLRIAKCRLTNPSQSPGSLSSKLKLNTKLQINPSTGRGSKFNYYYLIIIIVIIELLMFPLKSINNFLILGETFDVSPKINKSINN